MASIDEILDQLSASTPETQWVDASVLFTVITETSILNSGRLLLDLCESLSECESAWHLSLTVKQTGSRYQKVEISLNGADPELDFDRLESAVRALESVLAFEADDSIRFNVNSGEIVKWDGIPEDEKPARPLAFPAPAKRAESAS